MALLPEKNDAAENPGWNEVLETAFTDPSLLLTSIPRIIQPHEFYRFTSLIAEADSTESCFLKSKIDITVNGEEIDLFSYCKTLCSDVFFGYSKPRQAYVVVKMPVAGAETDTVLRHYHERYFMGGRAKSDPHGYWPRMLNEGKILHPLPPHDVTDCGVYEMVSGAHIDNIPVEVRINKEFVAAVGMQIAHALEVAHDDGVVHRDMKTQSVFIVNPGDNGPFVKVIDMNMLYAADSDIDEHGMGYGTPQYVPPQEFLGHGKPNVTTDFYALGVILYRMLTGRFPFEGDIEMLALLHLHSVQPNPIDSPLWPIISRMLARRKPNRFQSGREIRLALKPFVQNSDIARYMQPALDV